VRDAWLVAGGIALGWLASKTWSDPDCRLGLIVFLVITAVLVLVFAIAVTANRPPADGSGADGPDDGDPR